MKKIFIILTSLFLFSACSFKTPPNQWQIKSSTAFSSYTNNFLHANELMAKNDLQRAIKHAKMSANLNTLARIYLGECALNISVGVDDKCESYTAISELINDQHLKAYYKLITASSSEEDLPFLTQPYKKFVKALKDTDTSSAIEIMMESDKITSKLLLASLLKEKLDTPQIKNVIESASIYGYKKAVLYWLKVLKMKTENQNDKNSIHKKISILESI